jgi:2-octaprenyl-6-methoxyphenol hydroxylase
MSVSHAVLIQGGGPVGLACAAWLLQKNPQLSLALLDRNPEQDADIKIGDQRGIALSHGSKLLLDTIGAWPQNCPAIHQIHVSQAGRFGRALMTREELKQEALGHISRYHDIHLALRSSLRAFQGQCPNFVWQHGIDETVSVPESVCLVHAEGGLFKQQDWVESGRDYQQSALVATVELEKVPPNQAWERFTEEGPLALLPSHFGPNILNLVWCASPQSSQRREALSDADFLNELQSTFGRRLGRFKSIANRRLYDLGLNYRKDVYQGHEVWIGNAAQTLHPVAGQGLNLGLRDAYLLAEKLADAFKTSGAITAASVTKTLAEYAQSRALDRRATIGITDFLARIFTSPLLSVKLARGFALSALQWLPPVKFALAKQMMFGRRSSIF